MSSSSSPEPSDDIPDHGGLVPDEVHDLIRRAHWQSAKSVEDVAPHQYVVIGWNKDDLTDEEFRFFVRTIKELGRLEEWTPPEGFYDSGNRRPMRNRYLSVGEYAYWFTRPRVPMLNREHVSVQQATQSRRVVRHRALPNPSWPNHDRRLPCVVDAADPAWTQAQSDPMPLPGGSRA